MTVNTTGLNLADTELARFVAELRDLVYDEATTVRERIQGVWARPLSTRVADGRAIAPVRIHALESDGLVELTCPRNESRFREGDMLLLNRGDPFADPRILVTLEADDDTRLFVSSDDPALAWRTFAEERDGWVLDEGYLDISQMLLDTLAQAADTAGGRERVLPLLTGRARPAIDAARYAHGLALGAAAGLNENQTEALAQAYASDLAYLIQGPPGTGKTAVLAYLAQALVNDGERVLITAFTHRAINHALNTLARIAPDTPAIKIGRHARADDLAVENYESFEGSPLATLSDGYVIGATPFATRTGRLSGVEFDTVIFDEASQITLPLAIMGMLVAKKFIFIGDHCQLPPVLMSRAGNELLHGSVFGALVDRGFDTLLTETYRLNAELLAWPSAQFYDGQLRPATEAIAARRLAWEMTPGSLAAVLDPETPLVFLDVRRRNTTTRSRAEASAIADLVTALLAGGIPPSEIGIVTPFRAQSREIRTLLRRAVPDPIARQQIVVDTVERMQGQERDVIIVSLTTSNPLFAAEIADFFFQPERLNVAITRPRVKLIIVGSHALRDTTPVDLDQQLAVEWFNDLLDACAYRTLATYR
ncbi:MAG TPA: AAA domain-containing protein [Roseiflexaceae bacterium]|nr:AAA domain-containing protein [Roseiflexaceae bacterium]